VTPRVKKPTPRDLTANALADIATQGVKLEALEKRLEEHAVRVESSLAAMQSDVAAIRSLIQMGKGAWKVLGILAAIGAFGFTVYKFFAGGR
jgi:hypothetical protein